MKHMIEPAAGIDVVPLAQPFKMEGGSIQGTAIALQLVGTSMSYLVVSESSQTAPVWVPETEVSIAYIGERP